MINVRKKDGETTSALLFRFSKKVKQSGVLREAKKRRFKNRSVGRTQRRRSALHRTKKKIQFERMKKLGTL